MRDHHLRERRMALGVSQARVAQAAGMKFSMPVSLAERAQATEETVQRVRRGLIQIELLRRKNPADFPAVKKPELSEHDLRIRAQEALWHAVPDGPEKEALLAGMLSRCLDLMHEGRGEECDAIAEFLPQPAVRAMFDLWEEESEAATAAWVAARANVR